MTYFRSKTIVVGYVTMALFGGAFWLTHVRQPTAFAEGRSSAKSGLKRNESLSIAVVELFTSEGCSSCPPADENLRRIEGVAAMLDQNVFPLSFHVDYRNRLGWKDPFSQVAFSDRQREYAELLKSDTYTPQLIVNGTSEFVGSDRRLSDQKIRKALETPAKHLIALSALEIEDQSRLSFRYQITGPHSKTRQMVDEVFNIAVATDLESVSVPRGENSGRKLSHIWVVKSFQVIPLDSLKGTFEFERSFVKPKHSRVVAYVQSRSTGAITGASALSL